jgi:hypothetical protein
MNTETAIVIALALAMLLVASLYTATTQTTDTADGAFGDLCNQFVDETGCTSETDTDETGGGEQWRKEPRLSPL